MNLNEDPTRDATASGISDVAADELRQQVRARLLASRLPSVDGMSSSRRGTGRPCVVCRRAIESTQVERQVQSTGVFLYAHEDCYKVWREESVARSQENRL